MTNVTAVYNWPINKYDLFESIFVIFSVNMFIDFGHTKRERREDEDGHDNGEWQLDQFVYTFLKKSLFPQSIFLTLCWSTVSKRNLR